MKGLIWVSFTIVLIVALTFGACSTPAPVPTPTTPSSPVTPAQPAKPPIRIGGLYTLTGSDAISGKSLSSGAILAFEQANYEVAGRKIEFIMEDDAAKTEVAVDKLKKLVLNDKIDLLIGPAQSGEKFPVAQYMDQSKLPHILDTPAPLGLAQFKWTFWSNGSEPMMPSTMGRYAYEEMGIKKVNAMAGDFVPGHGFLGAFLTAFKKRGGQVVTEQYTPAFQTNDFASYFTKFQDADAVVAWYPGNEGAVFLTQYEDFGIRKRMPFIAAFYGSFFSLTQLRVLPAKIIDGMLGDKCAAMFTSLISTDNSKKFVADFRAKYNYDPGEGEADAYTGAKVAYEAF
jgi:branched-chain amino acid transport system substrate-binding protein